MKRREFIKGVAGGALAAHLGLASPLRQPHYKAAIIGYTGHGNYGHSLDVLFNHHPAIEVVAVADPDPAGRTKAQGRSSAHRAYADYREMLDREKPDLVTVATRWSELHYDRVLASLQVGAHVFCEKPFTESLAQADELLAVAKAKNLKIACAHQARLAPSLLYLKRKLSEGLIGDLWQMRLRTKDPRRAGGEDMVVLGGHEFQLARFFAGGGPLWCTARILQDGREVTKADIHPMSEADGPVVGNEIEAMFAFPGGLNVHFSSNVRQRDPMEGNDMVLIGSRGQVSASTSRGQPQALARPPSSEAGLEKTDRWSPLPGEIQGARPSTNRTAGAGGGQPPAGRRLDRRD